MKLNKYFEPKRFFHLIKNDILTSYRTLLIAVGAVTGVLLVINVSSALSSDSWSFHLPFYPLVLFIGGFLLTSSAFAELHHNQKSYVYLTLPCSILEKFLCKLLLTSIGYVAGSMIFYYIFSAMAAGINMLIFGVTYPLFNPFHAVILRCVSIYLVTQSIFLFAAVYFKNHAFIKLLLSLFALSLAIGLFTALAGRIIFWDYFSGFGRIEHFGFADPFAFQDFMKSFAITFSKIAEIIFWAVMAPFFWILSFLRLKETEV